MAKKKYHFYGLCGVIVASSVSALGTVPYGFQFAQKFQAYSHGLAIALGVILGFSAAFANAILGIYSFLHMKTNQKLIKPSYLMSLSFISAVPVGCMCFFAYHSLLPWYINIVMTLAVTLINAAIGYTAILNLVLEFKHRPFYTDSRGEIVCRLLGFIIGTTVSLAAYMASIHGLSELFAVGLGNEKLAFRLACMVGFLAWLPFAALFANGMQKTAGKIYYFAENFSRQKEIWSAKNTILLLLAFCSGASFAQIAITFFNPNMHIPMIFKALPIQSFIYSILVPLAFISSSAVNFIALNNILKMLKKPRSA